MSLFPVPLKALNPGDEIKKHFANGPGASDSS